MYNLQRIWRFQIGKGSPGKGARGVHRYGVTEGTRRWCVTSINLTFLNYKYANKYKLRPISHRGREGAIHPWFSLNTLMCITVGRKNSFSIQDISCCVIDTLYVYHRHRAIKTLGSWVMCNDLVLYIYR